MLNDPGVVILSDSQVSHEAAPKIMSRAPFEIVVVGGSISGLAFTVALQQLCRRDASPEVVVRVLERRGEEQFPTGAGVVGQ